MGEGFALFIKIARKNMCLQSLRGEGGSILSDS